MPFEAESEEIRELVSRGNYEAARGIGRQIWEKIGDTSYLPEHRAVEQILKDLLDVPVRLGLDEIHATIVDDIFERGDDCIFGRPSHEKVWLISIASGMSTLWYAAPGATAEDALDAYADNDHTCLATLVSEDDLGDTIAEEDCVRMGNAGEPHFFEGLHVEEIVLPQDRFAAADTPWYRAEDLRRIHDHCLAEVTTQRQVLQRDPPDSAHMSDMSRQMIQQSLNEPLEAQAVGLAGYWRMRTFARQGWAFIDPTAREQWAAVTAGAPIVGNYSYWQDRLKSLPEQSLDSPSP